MRSGRLPKIWLQLIFVSAYCNILCSSQYYYLNDDIDIETDTGHRSLIYEYNGDEDFLVNTTGCYIPNYAKNFRYPKKKYTKSSCGTRAIFIEKVHGNTIKFRIDGKIFEEDMKDHSIHCCYRFAYRNDKDSVRYTSCRRFRNGTQITLDYEIILVSCARLSLNHHDIKKLYEDTYLLLKKKHTPHRRKNSKERSWNVLMLGMDTMSRSRVYDEMPKTSKYFHTRNWVDFRGYQKVGYNTLPNMIAFLTGRKTVFPKCEEGMYECNDIFIWSRFKEAGYKTAYGEDNLILPDTFTYFKGFREPPTDHYIRHFFLTGEYESGNLVCTGKRPSALHLLDYASKFSKAYKNDKFFGFFWLNSYTHDVKNDPTLIDEDVTNLFDKLNTSGVLDNTFILFLSDHGVRYGPKRESVELYYADRLPALFLWVPLKFREIHNDDYYRLRINENRLVTPYDLHATLWDILKLSNSSVNVVPPEECPQCSSLFKEVPEHRTCADVNVSEKWCTCHNMVPVSLDDKDAKPLLLTAVLNIQEISQRIATTPCHICSPLTLKTLYRIHSYIGADSKKYFVTAFSMKPGNFKYEANLVKESDDNYQLLRRTYTISPYGHLGYCVIHKFDCDYCVCEKIKNC